MRNKNYNDIVSVRMPSSLVRALKKLQAKNHYLDLSEEIRSIVRKKCLEYSYDYLDSSRLTKLRKELKKELNKPVKSDNNEIISQMKSIMQKLKQNEK
jgi:Arc/MetJ-type ribon-helix-helix transcriptional regulator